LLSPKMRISPTSSNTWVALTIAPSTWAALASTPNAWDSWAVASRSSPSSPARAASAAASTIGLPSYARLPDFLPRLTKGTSTA
ncbi:unnamed protein product, partial [Ilex paraguariensis]